MHIDNLISINRPRKWTSLFDHLDIEINKMSNRRQIDVDDEKQRIFDIALTSIAQWEMA